MSRSRQVVAEKRMWCSKVRMPKDKYKNTITFSSNRFCACCIVYCLNNHTKKGILKESKAAAKNVQGHSFALSTFKQVFPTLVLSFW